MNAVRNDAYSPRPLEALGIDEQEEHAYRVVLSHRLATAEDVAQLLSLSLRKTQRLLDSIEFKGLVSHSPSRPRRYVAAPPEFAVEALIAQRQAVLESSRSAIAELKEQARNSSDSSGGEQAVELVTGRAAVGLLLVQLFRTMRHEMVGFQRAPMLYVEGFPAEISSKITVKSVSDSSYLALPGALDSLRLAMEQGEDARVYPNLPVKMIVIDRRIGLIPLDTKFQGGTVLVIRSPSLIDAFYALFELIWERATPIAFTNSGKLQQLKAAPVLSEGLDQLISLLAAGLNDKAIAHQTGMSATTLNRRIADLMKHFNTRSRFQLGWRAALETLQEGPAAKPVGKRVVLPRSAR